MKPLVLFALSLAWTPALGYDWPIKGVPEDESSLYSTLGEFRPVDSPYWTNHGAVDFQSTTATPIFSPDTGKVRFGDASDKNSGIPPVKIGHFALLHFGNVNNLPMDPAVLGDKTIWTYIVKPDDTIFTLDNNHPKPTTLKTLGLKWYLGLHPTGANTYERAFFYSQTEPIGYAPTNKDLHVIFYAQESSAYSDQPDIRNALAALNFKGSSSPEIFSLRFYAQKKIAANKPLLIDLDAGRKSAVMLIKDHAGVDITIGASSFSNGSAKSGIYKLAYAIGKIKTDDKPEEVPPIEIVIGKPPKKVLVRLLSPEKVMFEYNRMPTKAQDANLTPLPPTYVTANGNNPQEFAHVDGPKHTTYVVTNINGNDAEHWELENLALYPDGEYVLLIHAWKISESTGAAAPKLSDTIAAWKVAIVTDTKKIARKITVGP